MFSHLAKNKAKLSVRFFSPFQVEEFVDHGGYSQSWS